MWSNTARFFLILPPTFVSPPQPQCYSWSQRCVLPSLHWAQFIFIVHPLTAVWSSMSPCCGSLYLQCLAWCQAHSRHFIYLLNKWLLFLGLSQGIPWRILPAPFRSLHILCLVRASLCVPPACAHLITSLSHHDIICWLTWLSTVSFMGARAVICLSLFPKPS